MRRLEFIPGSVRKEHRDGRMRADARSDWEANGIACINSAVVTSYNKEIKHMTTEITSTTNM